MEEALDKAIKKMAEMVAANQPADGAMKYAQAALNLAHTKALLAGDEEPKPKRGRPPKVAVDEA